MVNSNNDRSPSVYAATPLTTTQPMRPEILEATEEPCKEDDDFEAQLSREDPIASDITSQHHDTTVYATSRRNFVGRPL
jgi:hypothetical protein